MTTVRIPPHDIASERELIGCCLVDREIHGELVHLVQPGHFFRDAHAYVWEALQELERAGTTPDMVTLRSVLADAGRLARVGGDEALLDFGSPIPTLANATAHAKRVMDLATVRAVIHAAHLVAAEGYEPIDDVPGFLARAGAAVADAAEQRGFDRDPVTLGKAAEQSIERLVARQSGNVADGAPVSTGLRTLDWMLAGGNWPGRLVIVAGRPGMGKSALAQGMAVAAATRGPALVFSLEMPADEMGDRAIALDAQIDGELVRASKLSDGDMRRIMAAADRLQHSNVWIDDTPAATAADIRRVARRHKRKHGLSVVVIDYLQLMRPVRRSDSREQEVAEISRSLKALAKELGVPVVALSQLSRKCEERGDKRPMLSDLRESGAIEQDADVVVFVYRDEIYNTKSTDVGLAELVVAKQRGGRTGTVKVVFRKELTAFFDMDRTEGGYA